MIRIPLQFLEAHSNSIKRFGSLSRTNKRKLLWKDRTHGYIDQIWNIRQYCTRKEMYNHLENHLGSSSHVTFMTITKMKKVILWAIDILNEGKKLDDSFNINNQWEIIPIPNFVK